MDFKQIQELIKMINKSNIGEVTIEEKDFKVNNQTKRRTCTECHYGSSSMPVSICTTAATATLRLRNLQQASADKPKAEAPPKSYYYQKSDDRYILSQFFSR